MADTAKKVLFVNSEMSPFLPDSRMALICRNLPQGIQERKKEIRSFMPKYGCINERKNQLHEVIRLSGMNLIISDVDEGLAVAAKIGDDYLQKKARGYTQPETFNHGTSDQRSRWLKKGFSTGNPALGDTFSPSYSQL